MNEIYKVNPGHLTSPEENRRRAKLWENQPEKVRKRKLSCFEILNFCEKRCDFTEPKGEIEKRVCNVTSDLLPEFEGLKQHMYKPFDYTPYVYTTHLKRNRFKPSEEYQKLIKLKRQKKNNNNNNNKRGKNV